MDIFKKAREAEEAKGEAWEAREKAAWYTLMATPAWKAYEAVKQAKYEAEDAMKETSEYKDWKEADEALKAATKGKDYEEARKAREKEVREAWEAVKATPEHKDWKEAEKAMEATPAYKNWEEASEAYWGTW